MKRKLLFFLFLLISFLMVFSNNFYWYRTSEGSSKVDVFKPVKESEENGVLLVAAGVSGIFTSQNGIIWTERTFEGYNEWHHRAVSGNKDGFVVGGDYSGAGLVTSENGISWQSHQLTGSSIHDIVWSEEKKLYVAVGEWGQSMIRWSTDGTNWNHMDVTSGQTLNGVAYGNGEFLAVGEWGDGGIYSSNDGSTWVKGNNNYGNNFHSIEYGQGKFVAVGEGIIAYKSNGSDTFDTNVSGFSTFHTLNDIIWDGSIYVAVGDAKYVNGKTQAIVYTSSDGVNWTRQDTNINTDLESLTYSEELSAFFAVGDGLVLTSTDGYTWSQVNAVDQQGNSLNMNLESIFSQVEQTETETPEWAVFAINGKINLTRSSSIEPLDSDNVRGQVGTNANELINGEHPVKLGQGSQSLITPCDNFYFGPSADPSELVGGGNLGDEAIARLNCLKNNAKVLNSSQSFLVPEWLSFEEPGVLGLPQKGNYLAGWSGDTFIFTSEDNGFYESFKVHSDMTINVYDEDVIILTDTLELKAGRNPAVRINHYGKGKVFFLVNESLSLIDNTEIHSYDSSGNKLDYDDKLYIFYNGTAPLGGTPQFHFPGILFIKNLPLTLGGSTSFGGLVALSDSLNIFGDLDSSRFIYAPQADITIDNGAKVYGTIIGKSLDILNDGKIKYNLEEIVIPEIPIPYEDFDWKLLVKEGYDLRGNVYINGNVAVHKTEIMNTEGEAKLFEGDLIINELTDLYTVSELDSHNIGGVVLQSFKIPGCMFENNPGDEYNNASGTIQYAGNKTINGMLYAPNASEVRILGTTNVLGGICAPNATLIIRGTGNIKKFILVKRLEMRGNPTLQIE